MKKAFILFIIVFIATLLIPMIAIVQTDKSNSNELVTIFSSNITLEQNYHLLSQDQF
jgi:hypothetical protein